jgi:hypothetical protein
MHASSKCNLAFGPKDFHLNRLLSTFFETLRKDVDDAVSNHLKSGLSWIYFNVVS